jgi:molecular chaperone GrpE (heat shock protein)
LPVLDNFEMALAAAQTAQGDKLASLQSGVAMIQQQLQKRARRDRPRRSGRHRQAV